MRGLLDSFKARVIVILIVVLALSHVAGLLIYAQLSARATALLDDALVAERIALVAKIADGVPVTARREFLRSASGSLGTFTEIPAPSPLKTLPEGSRPHLFEHLLGVFLNKQVHQGMRVSYDADARGLGSLRSEVGSAAHSEAGHIPAARLAEIHPVGSLTAQVELADGSWIEAAAPLLSVSPFSTFKFGAALAAMLTSVLLVAGWALWRWTQPLDVLSKAAERLGTDIHAPPLPETGPSEVRAAAKAFNGMQGRIRRLVEDRVALAAAIGHDLGTPITRLQLRAEDIEDTATREGVLSDLDQMRRMITATLGFARLDFSREAPETFDLMSLVQSVANDLHDGCGAQVPVTGPSHLPLHSKPVACRRALFNIADNAVKHAGGARIEVCAREERVEIAVLDEGPGIPAALQEAAFEPFRRLTEQGEGTGLGLTVARSLVRGLGGELTLASRREKGLRVLMVLPMLGPPARPVSAV